MSDLLSAAKNRSRIDLMFRADEEVLTDDQDEAEDELIEAIRETEERQAKCQHVRSLGKDIDGDASVRVFGEPEIDANYREIALPYDFPFCPLCGAQLEVTP